jgi:hypothetical protein
MVKSARLPSPAMWLLLPRAHKARILGDRDGIGGDVEGSELERVLWQFAGMGAGVCAGIAAYAEGSSGHRGEGRQKGLDAVEEGQVIPQRCQTWWKPVGRRTRG